MSFSDLMAQFIPGMARPAVAPVPPLGIPLSQAAQGQTLTNPATAPNGMIPAGDAAGAATKPIDPLEGFKDLWTNAPVDPKAPGPVPLFANASQADMLAMAQKQDFRSALTPEQIAVVTKGGPEAMQVMMTAMNDMAQKVYATSAHATVQLITGALDKSGYAKVADIPKHIKSSRVSEELRADNPLFTNPAVAPIMKDIEARIMLKHPEATSAETAQMAREYFAGIAETFGAPAKAQKEKESKKGQTDWSTFL